MNARELEESLGMIEDPVQELKDLQGREQQLNDFKVEVEKAFNLAKQDMNFLAGLAMPDVMEFPYPPTYLAIWEWVTRHFHKVRDFSKLALGMPRGFAKTTVVKLLILYAILFTQKRFILIISNTEQHAKNIIADVVTFLDEPNIKKIFGDALKEMSIDKQELKIFSFMGREIILAGIGAEGSIRGMNLGHRRPDIMVFEDFQTKEDSESELLSQKLIARMFGTIMKAKDPRGCTYLFIANMYPTTGSILRKLKDNPTWTKFIVGGILSNGTSLWEELQPLSQLLEELESDRAAGQEEQFYAEVLNDETAGIKAGIDINKIPACPYDLQVEQPSGRWIIIDPAGEKQTSDLNAVAGFGLYDGKPVMRRIKQGHWSPLELIKQSLLMAIELETTTIVVENVAYQQSLLFWFTHVTEQMQLEGFNFVPINPKSKQKAARIKAMLKGLVRVRDTQEVEQYLSPEVRAVVIRQILDWNPLQPINKDELLDLLAYTPAVLSEYSDLIASEYNVTLTEFIEGSSTNIVPAHVNSPF